MRRVTYETVHSGRSVTKRRKWSESRGTKEQTKTKPKTENVPTKPLCVFPAPSLTEREGAAQAQWGPMAGRASHRGARWQPSRWTFHHRMGQTAQQHYSLPQRRMTQANCATDVSLWSLDGVNNHLHCGAARKSVKLATLRWRRRRRGR